MFTADETGVYARVEASPARRFFAITVLFGLGALFLYYGLVEPLPVKWMIVTLALGGMTLWWAEKLRRATRATIELTEEELRDTSGKVLARIEDIRAVERGALSFKPSNGFSLVLSAPQPRSWSPGLWWRIGRRVGVGGVTSGGQAKFMAEQIAFRLSQRES
ncbi:hypothetical protein [Yoonia sp.]|uniref:hypothetical protein n=1 Tax=Yoonia sp. TaxID=2212373 RepID=UPI001A0F4C41|nr:hypothetical protein [Yoonia sp.]MBE0414499.1 hypothetical protein [Yoonia sp.]